MREKVRESSPGERSKTTGIRFVKQVGFKPGVKQRELWMSRVAKKRKKWRVKEDVQVSFFFNCNSPTKIAV